MKTMTEVLAFLRNSTWIDLTHAFDKNIPHSIFFQPEQRTTLYHYDEGIGTLGAGILAHEYKFVGQYGTHVDPPSHFVRDGRSVDEIPIQEMVLPLALVDISARAEVNPDTELTKADLILWEEKNGRLPDDCFVAMRTGWSERWPDKKAMQNADPNGTLHYPGWSLEALEFLAQERSVIAIGHDTTDTDCGIVATKYQAPVEDFWLKQDKWQIEMLCNLDKVPSSGALILCSWAKPKKGSGFPARCIAIF
ncbi:cyclase family protein [Burkholderia sp. L27(2015)]|uniref:cyclase family protein n=1 Tax=Burkholderia sp. L27(2015) TaxID=1641858 RepID=UPI00131D0183|nr:cyclase family protein [Burkholderia sp. L27(2015)]